MYLYVLLEPYKMYSQDKQKGTILISGKWEDMFKVKPEQFGG